LVLRFSSSRARLLRSREAGKTGVRERLRLAWGTGEAAEEEGETD
jgi:hypothetical protein